VTSSLWQRVGEDSAERRYRFGTRRAIPPAVTLRRLKPLLDPAGITRLADVTGLDCIGIPVYQAVRPNSRNLSVSQGKGLTRVQAQVSALMEALECFHAEAIAQPTVWMRVGAMRRELAYDPYALLVEEPTLLTDETMVEWIAATDLWTGATTWVPRELCELNYCVEERHYVPLFRTTSNGLASGNTIAEALVHGLCEVIERDGTWRSLQGGFDAERAVRAETVYPRLAQQVLERFSRAGLRTLIVDASGPTGLPCFEVLLGNPDLPTVYYGAGCSPSRATALLRALTEAAQSRLTGIAGSRDDITRRQYQPMPTLPRTRQRAATSLETRRSYRSTPTLASAGFVAELRDIIGRVRVATGMSPLAVDLTRPSFGLPVVYVVAPGLRHEKL
jgi:YcaO-like protein with predicted kinase domain